jgi:hypothetical protein
MRITEILTESQLEQLDEGPILNKIGSTVGNVAGGVAKGVGAVAGGIAGLGSAFKKGFDRSKGIVGQGGDYVAPPDAAAAPAAAPAAAAPAAPAPAPSGDAGMSTTTPPSAAEINAQGPKGTAPAKAQTGDAGKALAKSTAVVDKQQAVSQQKANQTVYAQIKANVDKLDKKGKQQILQLLQKSMSAPAAAPGAPKPGAPKPGAPGTPKPGVTAPSGAGAGAFANMAKTLSQEPTKAAADPAAAPTAAATPAADPAAAPTAAATPAADPAATTPAAKSQTLTPQQQAAQAATKARLQGTKAAGKSVAASTTGGFNKFKAAANAKGIATASKTNYGNALSEDLARRVEFQKQKMFETGLAQGTISIFRK